MSTTTIDLTPFCEPERPMLAQPWVKDGVRYASNGFVLVALDAPGEPDSTKPPGAVSWFKFHDAAPVIKERFEKAGEFNAVTELPEAEAQKVDCEACDGYGFDSKECDECYGRGYTNCSHCGNDADCDECDGDGVVQGDPCKVCKGAKLLEQPWSVTICGLRVRVKFAELLLAMPGPVAVAKSEHSLVFRFDGGKAVLMSIAEDK